MKSEKIDPEIYKVEIASRSEVKEFIESNHYSQSINGVKVTHCFTLSKGGVLIGAALYGQCATRNQWLPYGSAEDKVLELRRLVLIDDTPRNAESYFISRTLRWLKRNTEVEAVVSYADPNWGHQGVVYKASNFQYKGKTAPTKVVVWKGREYHDRALRTKYKGQFKPFAQRLRNAVETGEAVLEKREPKNIFVYRLRKEL